MDVLQGKLVYEFHHVWHESHSVMRRLQGSVHIGLLVQNKPFMGPLFPREFGWPQSNPTAPQMNCARQCIVNYIDGLHDRASLCR